MGSIVISGRGSFKLKREFAQCALPGLHLCKDGEHLFAQGIVWMKICVLCQVANAQIAISGYSAFIGLFTACQQVEKCRLTGAIGANESYAVLFVDLEADPGEDPLRPQRFSDLNDANYGHEFTL